MDSNRSIDITRMGKPSAHNRWAEAIGAFFLIGAGVIFLLQNLGLLAILSSLLWAGLFLGGGALFLLAFAVDRSQWWPLIPGSALVGLGLTILLGATLVAGRLSGGEFAGAALFVSVAAGFAGVYAYDRRQNWWALIPAAATGLLALVILSSAIGSGELGAAVLFFGLGLVFAALYFVEIDGRRHNWWTLIPAGALFSLAAVIILSSIGEASLAGGALFLGLGLTFGMLYLMRGPQRPLDWAWIPAVALLGFGVFIVAVSGDTLYARLFWPLSMIVAGLVLFAANLRKQRG